MILPHAPIIEGDTPIRTLVEARQQVYLHVLAYRRLYGKDDPIAQQIMDHINAEIERYLALRSPTP